MGKMEVRRDKTIARTAYYFLALFRIMLGLLFLSHGLANLFGFPPGMEASKVPWDSFHGIAGILDLLGGVMIVVGLWIRPVAFLLSGEMAIGYFTVHSPQGIFPITNGGELSVLYCFALLYFSAAGGGAWTVTEGRYL